MSASSQPSTLRERRQRETHREIRSVALALVAERGYDGATVDLIAERAGVSVRTFFNYFASKESAMIATPPPIPESAADEFLSHSGSGDLFADLAQLAVAMFEEGTSAPTDFQSSIAVVMAVPVLATLQLGALLEREHNFSVLIATRLALDPHHEQPTVIAAALTGPSVLRANAGPEAPGGARLRKRSAPAWGCYRSPRPPPRRERELHACATVDHVSSRTAVTQGRRLEGQRALVTGGRILLPSAFLLSHDAAYVTGSTL